MTLSIANPGNQSNIKDAVIDLGIEASGGKSPYTWTASGLPGGLNIDTNTGKITGTIGAKADAYTVTITVTDSAQTPEIDTCEFMWNVAEKPGDGTSLLLHTPGYDDTSWSEAGEEPSSYFRLGTAAVPLENKTLLGRANSIVNQWVGAGGGETPTRQGWFEFTDGDRTEYTLSNRFDYTKLDSRRRIGGKRIEKVEGNSFQVREGKTFQVYGGFRFSADAGERVSLHLGGELLARVGQSTTYKIGFFDFSWQYNFKKLNIIGGWTNHYYERMGVWSPNELSWNIAKKGKLVPYIGYFYAAATGIVGTLTAASQKWRDASEWDVAEAEAGLEAGAWTAHGLGAATALLAWPLFKKVTGDASASVKLEENMINMNAEAYVNIIAGESGRILLEVGNTKLRVRQGTIEITDQCTIDAENATLNVKHINYGSMSQKSG